MGARRLEKRKSNRSLSMKDTPFASFLDGKRFREACIEGKLQRNRHIT